MPDSSQLGTGHCKANTEQHQYTGQGEATQGHTDIQTTATSSSSVGYTTAESVEDSV